MNTTHNRFFRQEFQYHIVPYQAASIGSDDYKTLKSYKEPTPIHLIYNTHNKKHKQSWKN